MEVSSGKAGKEEAVTYHSRDNLKNFQIKCVLFDAHFAFTMATHKLEHRPFKGL